MPVESCKVDGSAPAGIWKQANVKPVETSCSTAAARAHRAAALFLPLVLAGCAAAIPALQSGAAAIAAHISAAPVAAAAGAAGVGLGVGVVVSDDLRKMLREAAASREETYPAGTFGAFVQEGQSAVLVLVQLAMRTQRDAQVVAGMQVHAALARGLAAFPDSRLKKIEDLSGAEARFRTDLDAAMAKLISQSDATVKSGGESAADASARLRVAADTPLVRTPGPIFLFPFLPTQEITIRGAFPAAYEKDSQPVLTVDGRSYKAVEYQADSLRFSIRTADLDAAEPSETLWKTAELGVPWFRPAAGFSSAYEIVKFRIVLGVLTQAFGSLEVEKTVTTTRAEEKARTSEAFAFSPDNLRADESRCLRLSPAEVSEGWKIRRASGAAVPENLPAGAGRHEWRDLGVQSDSEHAVCWKARAYFNDGDAPAGDAGARRPVWRISARIVLDRRESNVTTEKVDLAWGSRHSFSVPEGAWKLRFARNGSPIRELTEPDTSSPLIRVLAERSRVQISVYPY